ncbi:hypothetical protein PENSPDRAFT_747887 [Peniophora sp. CONT]|nr:hypothetical protein PENSPDRAFT_747887 [Peniophora sp. CONT]
MADARERAPAMLAAVLAGPQECAEFCESLCRLAEEPLLENPKNDLFAALILFVPSYGTGGLQEVARSILAKGQRTFSHLLTCLDESLSSILSRECIYSGSSEIEQLRLCLLLSVYEETFELALSSLCNSEEGSSFEGSMGDIVLKAIDDMAQITGWLWEYRDSLPCADYAPAGRTIQEIIGSYCERMSSAFRFLHDQDDSSADMVPILRIILWSWSTRRASIPLNNPSTHPMPSFASAVIRCGEYDSTDKGTKGPLKVMTPILSDAILDTLGAEQFATCLLNNSSDPGEWIVKDTLRIMNLASTNPSSAIWRAILDQDVSSAALSCYLDYRTRYPEPELDTMMSSFIWSCANTDEERKVLLDANLIAYIVEVFLLSRARGAIATAEFECAGKLIEMLKELFRTSVANGAHLADKAATARAIQISRNVQPVWYRALHRLRGDSSARKDVVRAWYRLGKSLELDEDTERAAFQRDADNMLRNCDWRDCTWYIRLPQKPVKRCKGCDRAYYCSSECQKRAWKEGGHKKACRAIKC